MIKVSINYLPGGSGADSPAESGERKKHMTLKLTVEEVKLLATLVSDQLFRRQYIDPKMPGYKTNPDEINLGKSLVVRLRLMLDENAPLKAPSTTGG
jgi:hypothetical protein